MNVKNIISILITAVVAVAVFVLGLAGGFTNTEAQLDALVTICIIAGIAALYCFVVGEISRNNSQMDKLWSIMPEIYLWVVAFKSGFDPRIVAMAVLATLWGARLTMNFARKGAYSIKFWSGEEDYRWIILRQKKILKNKFAWALFDLFFISIYQNFIVLATTFPAIAIMGSPVKFGAADILPIILCILFLVLETVADEQQWAFQQEKRRLLNTGKKLSELPLPYSRGFNTVGLWGCSRHPNYLGEQGFWISIYLFTISAGVFGTYFFNWTVSGCMLLVLLFLGSSAFGESVSSSKYPEYKDYCKKISKFVPIPWNRY